MPGEETPVALHEGVEVVEVARDMRHGAAYERLSRAQRDDGENLAGRRAAHRHVIF